MVSVGPDRGGPSPPNRPPALVAIDSSIGAIAIGIDFGHGHVRVAVANLAFDVHERVRPMAVADDATGAMDTACGMVETLLGEAGASSAQVIGVGMCLPGPLDRETRLATDTLLPGWTGIRPEQAMRDRLHLPVVIDNDANLGALGELVMGAGRGCHDVIYLLGTMGIGCGLIFGGRLYRGASGAAGEFGHMVVDQNATEICTTCGNRGCVDVMLGGRAIMKRLRDSPGRPERWSQAESPEDQLKHIIERARGGDVACQRTIQDVSDGLGRAVANLCTLLNPERVILGGPLSRAADFALLPIKEAIAAHALPVAAREVEVVPAALGEAAEVHGSLALVLREPASVFASRLQTLLYERVG